MSASLAMVHVLTVSLACVAVGAAWVYIVHLVFGSSQYSWLKANTFGSSGT